MTKDSETIETAAKSPHSLGNLAVREKLISQEVFDGLLDEFLELPVEEHLGQFLVRKGVMSQERLELFLIKQAALRNGGVEDLHVRQAMQVADRVSSELTESADELIVIAEAAGGE